MPIELRKAIPPELKSLDTEIERRCFESNLEMRIAAAGTPARLVGHAAVFDSPSEEMGWLTPFREQIRPGAFSQSILADDIRALFNHNPDWVLGRNRSRTLQLFEDGTGLLVHIDPPETSWFQDLAISIRRRDISQMSFAFQSLDEHWEVKDGMDLRVVERAKLYDVSPVTFPAYPQTDIGFRAAMDSYRRHKAAAPGYTITDIKYIADAGIPRPAGQQLTAEQISLRFRRTRLLEEQIHNGGTK
jgi:hypothetical protein